MRYILFIVYAFLIFVISNAVGKIFIKPNSKIYPIRSVVGFAIFIGLLQIIYYPFEFFHLSGKLLFFLEFVIIAVSLIYGFKKFKKDDLSFLKDYKFYILLLFFFGIMKIFPGTDATDDEYYFPLIIDNANNLINTINPELGSSDFIGSYHAYQGYYLFVSFIYKIQHFLFNSYFDVIISFRSTFTLLFVSFLSILLKYIKSNFIKKTNKYIYLLFEILSILLIGISHLNHIYYGSFVLFLIYIPIYIILIDYYVNNKKDNKYAIIFLEMGLLSFASSSLFLILMILSIYISYSIIIKKKIEIYDYALFLIPEWIYSMFMINIPILSILFFLLIFLINKYKDFINKLLIKYGIFLILLVPIIFFVVGITLGKVYCWESLSKSILIFNFGMLIIIMYLVFIKKVKMNSYIFLFIMTIIIYLNPFTYTFVSKFLTTSSVFYRVSFITKNPLIIICIFSFIYNNINKLYKVPFIAMCLGLIFIYANNLYKGMIKLDGYFSNYNYILRESYDNLELGKKVSSLNGKIISVDFSPRTYNSSLNVKLYRFIGTSIYDDDFYDVLVGGNDIDADFKTAIKKYDYIISNNKYSNKLEDFFDVVYENKSYKLYKVLKD